MSSFIFLESILLLFDSGGVFSVSVSGGASIDFVAVASIGLLATDFASAASSWVSVDLEKISLSNLRMADLLTRSFPYRPIPPKIRTSEMSPYF